MKPLRRPASLVAERAVRYLRSSGRATKSTELALHVLATHARDEDTARKILDAAFAGDPRLVYVDGAWREEGATPPEADAGEVRGRDDADRVFILQQGARPARGRPYEIHHLAAVRARGDDVIAACEGRPLSGFEGEAFRQEFLAVVDGAVPVFHDPPGARAAIERWMEEPLVGPVSLRLLARDRLGLPANQDLDTLAGRLGLNRLDSDEWLDQAELLDACLEALRRPEEPLSDIRDSLGSPGPAVPWSRFDFDRAFLRRIPRVPGTYRFFDADGRLLYVGKSKNLHHRIGSYFREGTTRPARVQRLLDSLHRIECEPLHSDLEAILREATEIARRKPRGNVVRRIHSRSERRARLQSIMIIEPAAPPFVLRAYLIREGKLVGRVGIGPRGGGLRRIERLLDDHFFCVLVGPTPATGSELDVELVARWLSANRDQVVAFDPTQLPGAREVTERLRYFLDSGSLFDPDGTPVLIR